MTSRITRSRKPQPVQQHENQVRAKWTASLTKTLVDMMVDQIQKGNKSNKNFSKKGWKFFCDNFRIQTGYWWDNEQLKSRYIALRKQYIIVRMLLNHFDFQWEETSGKIMAKDEAWVRYIKNILMLSRADFRLPMYNQLQIIFAEPEISGKHNRSTKEGEETPGSRGRGGMENGIAKGILEIASATKFKAEAIKKQNEEFSITDCIKALDELIDVISDKVYFGALDLLTNRKTRETFLGLKVEKRSTWL
ncbi:L10-interacting MYB domain-containing protein-like [Primulina huaijiensis]|uniref:L10-interacting MYB domain-containing protein-like n=1 Tax=Primulina huaijiensis TaxID=1492673 RepID=UPI003CC71299